MKDCIFELLIFGKRVHFILNMKFECDVILNLDEFICGNLLENISVVIVEHGEPGLVQLILILFYNPVILQFALLWNQVDAMHLYVVLLNSL